MRSWWFLTAARFACDQCWIITALYSCRGERAREEEGVLLNMRLSLRNFFFLPLSSSSFCFALASRRRTGLVVAAVLLCGFSACPPGLNEVAV